jgi:hypothetical protein
MKKENKLSEPLARINHKYYCRECYKYNHIILSCHDKPPLSKDLECPDCGNVGLKYEGGFDCRVTSTGNCGYESAEKISKQNIKRIGKEQFEKMCDADPVIKHKKESAEQGKKMWWRANQKDKSKPIDLSKIKDVKKYIEHGTTE